MIERKAVRQRPESTDLSALLRNVPLDLFVRMVNNSGMPTADARALIAAFKANKA